MLDEKESEMLNCKKVYLSCAVLLFSACGKNELIERRPTDSQIASITIGNFKPGENQPDWSRLKLAIVDSIQSTSLVEKTYLKSAFQGGSSEDISVKVAFGTYLFRLEYLDGNEKLLYRSCPNELLKKHNIRVSRYETRIDICLADSGDYVGDVTIDPVSEVTITPRPVEGSNQGEKTSGFWIDPLSQAMVDFQQMQQSSHPDARYIQHIANQPAAVWYGGWSGNVAQAVRRQVEGAISQDAYAIMIVYNIPDRDCGQHSSGGLEPDQYRTWINDMANAIGAAKTFVILEPDALTLNECLTDDLKNERYELLRFAIDRFKKNPNTLVYIDAGHSNWLSTQEVASRLKLAGIQKADGFALNTSNYQTTESNVRFGQQVRSLLGGKSFVVDTSRNGNGPTADSEWCNPKGRALGRTPSIDTAIEGLDAYLWLKRPGESDGVCNGGPAAGLWWREIAIEQAKNAGI